MTGCAEENKGLLLHVYHQGLWPVILGILISHPEVDFCGGLQLLQKEHVSLVRGWETLLCGWKDKYLECRLELYWFTKVAEWQERGLLTSQVVGQVYGARRGFPPTEQAWSTGRQLLVTLRDEHRPLVQLAFLAIVMAHKPYSWVGNIKIKRAFEMSYIQRNCLPMHHLKRMVHKFHLISGTI